jgi:CSLREA domain-containing protein
VKDIRWLRVLALVVAAVAALAFSAPAIAAVFQVNSIDDIGDGSCDAINCSLRDAIQAANAAPGHDLISFEIPGPAPHSIKVRPPGLPPITDPVTIDGTTDSHYAGTPVIEIDGSAAGPVTNGLQVLSTASGSEIRALAINRFTDAGILLGEGPAGTGLGNGSDDNLIVGNFVGTDVTGTISLGNRIGVDLTSHSDRNTVGGLNARDRNVISGNREFGILLEGQGANHPQSNLIVGNYVGVDATGNRSLGNPNADILIQNAPDNTVGGTTPSRRNVIGGSNRGVWLVNPTTTGALVQGNFIGIGADGHSAVSNSTGVDFLGSSGNTVGGLGAGAGNVVALNGGTGVHVDSGSRRDAILTNSIHDNGLLGIDLSVGSFGDGVTPNDPGDADTGANDFQNFPELTSATSSGSNTKVDGVLNSKPSTTYRLEFFASPACDPSGHGEGQTFLDARNVTTDATGTATFSFTLGAPSQAGDVVTSTATDPLNNTSEFSNCAAIAGGVGSPATLVLTPPTAVNPVGTQHCVTATVTDASGAPVEGVTVRFTVTGSDGTTITGQATTDANGQARFCYQGPDFPREDVIDAFADTNGNGEQDAGEPGGTATKSWVLPQSTPGCEVIITNGGWIVTLGGDRASFGGNAHVEADGSVKGEEQYTDHGPAQPLDVHSIDLLAVVCSPDRTVAQIYGRATVDGAGSHLFRIDVRDGGEPGQGNDVYGIVLDTGYTSGDEILQGGNVQIHDRS